MVCDLWLDVSFATCEPHFSRERERERERGVGLNNFDIRSQGCSST